MNWKTLRLGLASMGVGGMLALTGCDGFFVNQTTTGTGTGTGTGTSTTGDYAYVVNQTTNSLSAFSVGSGALTLVTGSPYALPAGLAAASVEVSRANTFVYVGGVGAIECFSISSSGTLSLVTASGVSESARFSSLTTSPDGQWLLALDSTTQTLYTFGINKSTGALSLIAQTVYSVAANVGSVVPTMVRVTPSGSYVIAALGTGGDVVLPFNTTTGVPTYTGLTLGIPSGMSDNAVAIDANSAYVYFARGGTTSGSSGITAFSLTAATGALTQVQTLATSGNAPYAIVLNSAGTYAYSANRADGTVTGFSVSNGMLTPLATSPYAAGTLATSLALDNSGKYLVAASFGGGADVTLYSFDATTAGKLNIATTGVSGLDPAGSIAVATTH
jgi:6-phosphogluconolactonase